jgi:hypothetical protein
MHTEIVPSFDLNWHQRRSEGAPRTKVSNTGCSVAPSTIIAAAMPSQIMLANSVVNSPQLWAI